MRRSLWIGLALAIFAAALYAPALRDGFLAFDDPVYVTANPHVRAGLTGDGVLWAFRAGTGGNWHPLTLLSLMLDCQLYGLRPWGCHLTNVLLHAANTALLFFILVRLTGANWRSAAAALLFAVHPAHVESVAWVSERKDVLCAFFFLLAILVYARRPPPPARKSLWPVVLLFALALMSKPMAVTLPFVLLLLDFWPLRRVAGWDWPVWRRLVFEKWPMLALSAIGCVVTVWAQGAGKAIATGAQLGFGERVNHTFISYLQYLRMLAFPRHLAALYPYQHHEPIGTGLCAALILALVTFLAFMQARRRPWLLVGWLWFAGMLAPVIGLVQVGGQAWADRYTYLPSIGIFILLVWTPRRFALALLAPVVAIVLAVVTLMDLRYWKDTLTLFGRAMEVTDNNYAAMTLVGSAEESRGNLRGAIGLYRQALACKAAYPEAHLFLGRALEADGHPVEAMSEYREAVRLQPDFAEAHIMIGLQLAGKKSYDQAATEYQAALQADPDSAVAQNDWATVLAEQGRWPESVTHYEQAVRLDPTLAGARSGLAVGYLRTGRLPEGIAQLRVALKLDPANTDVPSNLGEALNQQQQWAEAADILRPVVSTQPTNSAIQFQYGLSLEHLGREREAQDHYAAALRQRPDFPDALQHAAWIAATDARAELRNGAQAVIMATRACDLTNRQSPALLLTLAAAYAEAGRYDDAVAAADNAASLAKSQGQEPLAGQSLRLRALFAARHPYHGSQD
jgi:tetratricopeptide (TPR) repeat protein